MLRNLLCLLTSAAQRPAASAAVFSLWLAWTPSVVRRSTDRALDPWPFAASNRASSSAQLIRSKRRDGSEDLFGRTHFQLRGVLQSILVEESAQIAADGRLLRAEVLVRYSARGGELLPSGLISEATFDANAGVVSTLDREGRARKQRVAAGAPWVYVPISLPSGRPLCTPVAAVVARAAARAGPDVVRVAALTADLSLSSDQVWVAGANEEWVVLGDDLATFACNATECNELTKLHVAALGIDLKPSR